MFVAFRSFSWLGSGCSKAVTLPEDPAVVEAVLEHMYTGELPEVADPLSALALAHRLCLPETVAAGKTIDR